MEGEVLAEDNGKSLNHCSKTCESHDEGVPMSLRSSSQEVQQRGNFGGDQRQKAIVCFQKGVTVVYFRGDNLASGHSVPP